MSVFLLRLRLSAGIWNPVASVGPLVKNLSLLRTACLTISLWPFTSLQQKCCVCVEKSSTIDLRALNYGDRTAAADIDVIDRSLEWRAVQDDGRADERAVLQLSTADRGPVPSASHGSVVARTMRSVLRLHAAAWPVMLHQGQPALLQTRLRTVRLQHSLVVRRCGRPALCMCLSVCVCVFVRLLSNEMTFNPPDIRDMLVYLYPFKVTLVSQDHGSVFTARVGWTLHRRPCYCWRPLANEIKLEWLKWSWVRAFLIYICHRQYSHFNIPNFHGIYIHEHCDYRQISIGVQLKCMLSLTYFK